MSIWFSSQSNLWLFFLVLILSQLGLAWWWRKYFNQEKSIGHQAMQALEHSLTDKLLLFNNQFIEHLHRLSTNLNTQWYEQRNQFSQQQLEQLGVLQNSLSQMNQGLTETHTQASTLLQNQLLKLTQDTGQALRDISRQVETRLSEGFEKTASVFQDVLQRLTLIDQAQIKLHELSSNIVSLQDILNDKSARGTFGEIQLETLINNVLPAHCVSYQAQLSNGKRADCILHLPLPTGDIAIDAKFPLENYRRLLGYTADEPQKKLAEQNFKLDIKKHIQDIASKYIIPGETAEGAVMFIPAESVFARIHSDFPELVDYAQAQRVWLTSPTTLMAILTTARAVIKDQATQQQVHLIRKHLNALAKDFALFQKRMENLAKHIDQAHQDVQAVNTSAQKISRNFNQIDQAELTEFG
jgi:DNA recombination protein RmuC